VVPRGQPEPVAQFRADLSQPGPDRPALAAGGAAARPDQAEPGGRGEEAGGVGQRANPDAIASADATVEPVTA
jgi:hypothetical protein